MGSPGQDQSPALLPTDRFGERRLQGRVAENTGEAHGPMDGVPPGVCSLAVRMYRYLDMLSKRSHETDS